MAAAVQVVKLLWLADGRDLQANLPAMESTINGVLASNPGYTLLGIFLVPGGSVAAFVK